MPEREPEPLKAELIDAITEAVVKPADPRVRAGVIADLVHEVDAAVRWRNVGQPGRAEEQSLGALVDAAASHQQRMRGVDPVADPLVPVEPPEPEASELGQHELEPNEPGPNESGPNESGPNEREQHQSEQHERQQ